MNPVFFVETHKNTLRVQVAVLHLKGSSMTTRPIQLFPKIRNHKSKIKAVCFTDRQTDITTLMRISGWGLWDEVRPSPACEIANSKYKDPGFTKALVTGVFLFLPVAQASSLPAFFYFASCRLEACATFYANIA